jgi:hypothetical protein
MFGPRLSACYAVDVPETDSRRGISGAADGFVKVTTALSGGVSLGLAVAVLMPGQPLLFGMAVVAGVIGGSYLVKRYG